MGTHLNIFAFPKEPPAGIWSHAGLEALLDFVKMAISKGDLQPDAQIPIQLEPSKEVFDRVRKLYGKH